MDKRLRKLENKACRWFGRSLFFFVGAFMLVFFDMIKLPAILVVLGVFAGMVAKYYDSVLKDEIAWNQGK